MRITGKYIEGNSFGDNGYSSLSILGKISKGSSTARLYGEVESLQHSLNNFIRYNPDIVDPEDLRFFKWFSQALFCLSSFIYTNGESEYTDKYLFDAQAYDYMETRIEFFKQFEKEKLGSVESEFIQVYGFLNKLRLRVRSVEQAFWSLRDEYRLQFISNLQDDLDKVDLGLNGITQESIINKFDLERYFEVIKKFSHQGSFLNRASSFYYWASRYHYLVEGEVTHKEWISSMPKFKGT